MKKQSRCLECEKLVNNLPNHLQKHKISKKEYYDKYLKSKSGGFCICCKKPTSFSTLKEGYKKFCSVQCAKKFQSNNITNVNQMMERKRKTCIEKYNTEFPMKTEITKNNHSNTIIKKYGVSHYSKTDQFKEKIKHTSLEKYGAEHFNKTSTGKQKIKITILEKYGVDNISKLPSTKRKIRKTKLKKYGDGNYNNREKSKLTCIKKYGKSSAVKNKEIQKKIQSKRKANFINYLFGGNRLKNAVIPMFSKTEFTNVNEIYLFQCNKCGLKFKDNLDDGMIPKCPSCFKNNTISSMETDFLKYMNIPDGKENRQVKIDKFKVDGIIGNKIFEFLGDFWHGNPSKFLPNEINSCNGKPFGKLYLETITKLNKLHQLKYSVYYIWEKDWVSWLKGNIKTFPIKKTQPT